MVEFIAWVIAEALAASFGLSLASKWGWIEWAQVHAPTEFLYKLFSCKFCCSWWVCVGISVTLFLVAGGLWTLVLPIFATVICRELW